MSITVQKDSMKTMFTDNISVLFSCKNIMIKLIRNDKICYYTLTDINGLFTALLL